jgi:hypothetical protein
MLGAERRFAHRQRAEAPPGNAPIGGASKDLFIASGGESANRVAKGRRPGMSWSARIVVGAGIGLCAGCGLIDVGNSQRITVAASPATATCIAEREGGTLGSTSGQERSLTVSKSAAPIRLGCSAPGFQSQALVISSAIPEIWGVPLNLKVVRYGWGALDRYPELVQVSLVPEPVFPR